MRKPTQAEKIDPIFARTYLERQHNIEQEKTAELDAADAADQYWANREKRLRDIINDQPIAKPMPIPGWDREVFQAKVKASNVKSRARLPHLDEIITPAEQADIITLENPISLTDRTSRNIGRLTLVHDSEASGEEQQVA